MRSMLLFAGLIACGDAPDRDTAGPGDSDDAETDADTDSDTDSDTDTDTDADTDTGVDTPPAADVYHLLVADAAGTVYRIAPDGTELAAWTPAFVGLVGVAWAGDGFWVSSGIPTQPFLKLDLAGNELARVSPQPPHPLSRMGLDVLDGKI